MATTNQQFARKHVVIVGGGFGGLRAARDLAKVAVSVTLVDRANHHLFQPLLYQVATSGLAAEEIAIPIRSCLREQKNTKVLLGEVESADLAKQKLFLRDGTKLSFDYAIIAAGAQTNYYGNDAWQAHTVGLKDLEDAFALRRRVLLAFEAAERCEDHAERCRLLTFCIIGGGPTGVELAGAISELSRGVLQKDFQNIHADMIRVVLVEMSPRLLGAFDQKLSAHAKKELHSLGVDVRVGSTVTQIDAHGVRLQDELIPASVVCWAAGVRPRPLAGRLGVPQARSGAVIVGEDLSIPGHPNVFVIGDMAHFETKPGDPPLPGVAPVAMQQAALVARNIAREAAGKTRQTFTYFDKGIMATIGTSRAVLQYGRFKMTGLLAWLAWIFVHVYYVIGFRNRTMVMFDWFLAYVFKRRGARLISESHPELPA